MKTILTRRDFLCRIGAGAAALALTGRTNAAEPQTPNASTDKPNILLIISDPTIRGISAAVRMKELIGELRTHVGRIALVVNRASDGLPPEIEQAVKETELELIGVLPEDPGMMKLEVRGAPLTELPPDSPLKQGISAIAGKLGLL